MEKEKFSTKDYLIFNLRNYKARRNLGSDFGSKWDSCLDRLISLGDTIVNNMDKFTEDELKDFVNIFETANAIHNPFIPTRDKDDQLVIFENLLTQGEAQVRFLLNLPPTRTKNKEIDIPLPGENKVEQSSQEEVFIEDSSELELLQEKISNIQDNIDFFAIKLVFAKRDSRKLINSREEFYFNVTDDYLETYFKYVNSLYQRLQNIYHIVEKKIVETSDLLSNKDIIINLEKLVNIMYRTLRITDSKKMRANLGIADNAIKKFEDSLALSPEEKTPGKKV